MTSTPPSAQPPSPSSDLSDLVALVGRVARDEILPHAGDVSARTKADGSLFTEVDRAAQASLVAGLAQRWPDIPVLGEESPGPEQARTLAACADDDVPFWCVDPLDGTSNFVAGFPFWAVSVARVDRQGSMMGAVHDPIRSETFGAERGQGAWLWSTGADGAPRVRPLKASAVPPGQRPDLSEAMALVDLKRLPPEIAARIATVHPFRSQRNLGAAALEWCWVAAGRCSLYLHGGQALWDLAAGRVILEEAGGAWALSEGLGSMGRALSSPDQLTLDPVAVTAASSPALLAEWQRWLAS